MKSFNSDQDFVDDDVFEQHDVIEDHDVIDYKVTSNFYNIILTLKLKLSEGWMLIFAKFSAQLWSKLHAN